MSVEPGLTAEQLEGGGEAVEMIEVGGEGDDG